ncbi:ORN protein, partial [Crypturellus soui]|nr:ORN protein [Crypturellus soui]
QMTGLDVEKDHILEMACLITDCDLNVLAEGPHLIIKQPDELLDGMSEWCKEHHGKSGLTKAVKESKISLQQAEYEFLSFVRQQTPPGLCPLAGETGCELLRMLPGTVRMGTGRLRAACERQGCPGCKSSPFWDAGMITCLPGTAFSTGSWQIEGRDEVLRAPLDDIRESIKELQFYRDNIFKRKTEEKKRKLIENGESDKGAS